MNEIVINEWLQKGANFFLDALNLVITQCGDEMFFLAVAMIAFWCVDKRFGFKLINVYLLGSVVNSALKNVFKRPRPYDKGVASIGEKTGGYSFPSGHSHSIANLSTQAYMRYSRWQVLVAGIVITASVMFTRMYLGQHYLTDVLAGSALGVATAILFSFLFEKLGDNEHRICFVIAPLGIIVPIVLSLLKIDMPTIYKVCGGYSAVTLGYFLEKRYVKFNPKATIWQNVAKVAIGAVLVLAFKEGLKALFVLTGITHPLLYETLRYFLVAISATLLAPVIYKALRLENKSTNADKT